MRTTGSERQNVSSGGPWEGPVGYSRAVRVGRHVYVAGTTAMLDGELVGRGDAYAQAMQALRTIEAALAEAGASLADVVRVKYYVPDAADWPRIMPVLGKAFAAIRPAATALICGLVDPRMKIEIEVTARRRQP